MVNMHTKNYKFGKISRKRSLPWDMTNTQMWISQPDEVQLTLFHFSRKNCGLALDYSNWPLLGRPWINCPGILPVSSWFENNHTFKCWSGIFPKILTDMIILENCQDNILVYGCSQIQGTQFYSCWNLMKPGSQSGT